MIPKEFINEYNIAIFAHKGWVYFEICCGCYGLPQSGIMSKKQLIMILEKEGYYESRNMATQMETNPILFNCR